MKLVKHLVILLILLSSELAWSQKYDVQNILTEYEELLLNVGASVNDIPFSARRIALFEVSSKSDKPIIITQKLLRLQLEDVLKKKAFSVISVPEFEKKMILKIDGNDSLIKIDNQSNISTYRQNPDALDAVCKKYGVQSLVDCSLFFDSTNGFVMNIRFVNAISREVLWNETLYTRLKESTFKSRRQINFGVAFNGINNYIENNKIYIVKSMSTSNFVEFLYDQNTVPDKTAFFGLYARLNYYNFEFATTNASVGTVLGIALIPSAGLRGSKYFFPKQRSTSYWLEYYYSGGVSFYNSVYANAGAGLNVNLTKSFGFGIQTTYGLTPAVFSKENASVTLNNLNYALYLSYKF
jgi:hypothetical protein